MYSFTLDPCPRSRALSGNLAGHRPATEIDAALIMGAVASIGSLLKEGTMVLPIVSKTITVVSHRCRDISAKRQTEPDYSEVDELIC